jgi:bifunctional DNA-binding transcriptional regulator/antitoxin component of YhaV-PrlF toxin-antitoxin module
MNQNPAKDTIRYEVITQEDPVTGDLIIPLPPPVLENLGWKEGDDIQFTLGDNGEIYLTKK